MYFIIYLNNNISLNVYTCTQKLLAFVCKLLLSEEENNLIKSAKGALAIRTTIYMICMDVMDRMKFKPLSYIYLESLCAELCSSYGFSETVLSCFRIRCPHRYEIRRHPSGHDYYYWHPNTAEGYIRGLIKTLTRRKFKNKVGGNRLLGIHIRNYTRMPYRNNLCMDCRLEIHIQTNNLLPMFFEAQTIFDSTNKYSQSNLLVSLEIVGLISSQLHITKFAKIHIHNYGKAKIIIKLFTYILTAVINDRFESFNGQVQWCGVVTSVCSGLLMPLLYYGKRKSIKYAYKAHMLQLLL